MDWEYFRAISPLEFVGQAWNKAAKDAVAPNVVAWTQWFNKVCSDYTALDRPLFPSPPLNRRGRIVADSARVGLFVIGPEHGFPKQR